MNITIVMSYGLMAQRYISSTTFFELFNGDTISETSLPRRVKSTPSKQKWHNMTDIEREHIQSRMGKRSRQGPIPGVNPDIGSASQPSDAPMAGSSPRTPLSSAPGPSAQQTPASDSPGRRMTLNDAIRHIMDRIKFFTPPGSFSLDDDMQDGDEDDLRWSFSENITGQKMLKLYFRQLGMLDSPGEIVRLAEERPEELPSKASVVWRLTDHFFDINMLMQGRWPTFSQVTFDEGHQVRNEGSTFHFAASLLPKDRLLISTGTPLYNSINDVRGYSKLFSCHSRVDKHLVFNSAKVDVLDYITWSGDIVPAGIAYATDKSDPGFVESLHRWADEDLDRRQWWSLLAGYRSYYASSNESLAARAANSFIESMVVTRKMNTPLRLPSGVVWYPSKSLPPCEVRTVEVSHQPRTAAKLSLAVDVLMNNLFKKSSFGSASRKGKGVEPVQLRVEQILNLAPDDAASQMAMAYYRVMSLISFDMRNHGLFFDAEVHRRDPLARLSDKEVALLKKLSQDPDEDVLPEAGHEAKARFGTHDVRKLASLDVYGGLFWRYSLLAPPGFVPVDDVTHMLVWSLCESPVLFETVSRVVRAVRNKDKYGGRTLVLIDSPFAQL